MVQANDLKATIEAQIKGNNVMVYSKSYCPFATQTKNLLRAKGINAKIVELDVVANGAQIQNTLRQMTGQGTVPNVFIKGEHIGGNSDI